MGKLASVVMSFPVLIKFAGLLIHHFIRANQREFHVRSVDCMIERSERRDSTFLQQIPVDSPTATKTTSLHPNSSTVPTRADWRVFAYKWKD